MMMMMMMIYSSQLYRPIRLRRNRISHITPTVTSLRCDNL